MRIPDLFREYVWLVNTIYQAGHISLDEINRKWVQTFVSDTCPLTQIQKMIDAFELVKDYSPSYEEDILTVEQGVELFCKYYRDLSD